MYLLVFCLWECRIVGKISQFLFSALIFIYLCINENNMEVQHHTAVALLLWFILGINFITKHAQQYKCSVTFTIVQKTIKETLFCVCLAADTFMYHNNKDNSIKTPIMDRHRGIFCLFIIFLSRKTVWDNSGKQKCNIYLPLDYKFRRRLIIPRYLPSRYL